MIKWSHVDFCKLWVHTGEKRVCQIGDVSSQIRRVFETKTTEKMDFFAVFYAYIPSIS